MRNKSKLSVFFESMTGPYPWFLGKVILGIVVGYAIRNYLIEEDGKVLVDWVTYMAGTLALFGLYLISDVRQEYGRRSQRSNTDGNRRGRRRHLK